jgi:putative ABC transport system permease protein
MSFLTDLIERLRNLALSRKRERELAEEFNFHIEREVEERIRQGVAPEEARRSALLAFGGKEHYKEEVRDAGGVRPLQDLRADFHYALRALRRNAGFTVAVVLVLGLGIGASTAVFSVVDAVLLTELPYRDADRLVRVFQRSSPTNVWGLSVVDVMAIGEQTKSLEAFGAARGGVAALSGAGRPQQIQIARATSGFFQALQIEPARGRLIQPADEAANAPPVVVVSHGLAERSLGGASGAVGRSLTLDGTSHTVVGVLAPGVAELAGIRAVAWPAFTLATPTRRGPFGITGIGRLRAGGTLETAERDLAGISERIFPLWSAGFQDQEARLFPLPLRETIVGRANRGIGLFAAAVGLVLLIAVANVATLTLVRASARERELAVRAALGATRKRLAQLVITESLVLTFLAGILALVVAAIALRITGKLVPNLPRLLEVGLEARAIGFAFVAALVSGVLVGLAPVSQVPSGGSASAMRSDARAGGSRKSHTIRSILVVTEFALALPLLLGAGLLLNSFLRIQQVDPGFDPAGVSSVTLSLPAVRYPDLPARQAFWSKAAMRIKEIPGVLEAGFSTGLPPDTQGDVNNFNLVAHPVPVGTSEHVTPWSWVSPGYFEALKVPLLEGRFITDADTALPVAVVSRAWADQYFPRERVIGQQMVAGGCTECPLTTVVGVAGDIKYQGLTRSGEAVYEPLVQFGAQTASLVVRTQGNDRAVLAQVSDALSSLDPELPINLTRLQDRLDAWLANPRRMATVIAAFAGAALLLAALGIFGLMSFVVRQRRREIGVRLALGAQPAQVTRMIVARGMRLALIGGGIGVAVAIAELRWVRSLLFEVEPGDPATMVATGIVLLLTAVIACWLPGRRAARIKPIEAISSE